ncbi:MAG: T9SS type A sorting domain-containing protein [Armatimonadetes bacterium]|nr:T9SS type A sorting domain-containing protein [Armatimonadota bacterium]
MMNSLLVRYCALVLLRSAACLMAIPAYAQLDDSGWQPGYGRSIEQSGVDGEVFAIATQGNRLFVGGTFSQQGELPLGNVGEWDEENSRWLPLGTGDSNGVNGPVFAIATDGPCVYVAGRFTVAGGTAANNIACWRTDLRRWTPLQQGVSGGNNAYVAALAIMNDTLYVGGEFSTAGMVAAHNLASWDGTSWKYVGNETANGIGGTVNAIAPGHGVLYVGGTFTRAGELSVANLASWDGAKWGALGKGVNGYVNALAVVGDRVIAGGEFNRAGDTAANNIARWSVVTRTWLPLAAPEGNDGGANQYQGNGVAGVVRGMVADNNRVFVTGTFRTADPGDLTSAPIAAQYVARWYESGSDLDSGNIWWGSVGLGLNGYGNAVAMMKTTVFVGGAFTQAGRVNASHIARWNGKRWASLSIGINGPISALAVLDNRVWAAGNFNSADGITTTHVAILLGRSWQLAKGSIRGSVLALAADGQHLYAGGQFAAAGTTTALNIARYSPASERWSDLSFGVGGGEGAAVYAIAARAGNIYVGGRFTVADTVNAHNIAVWNAQSERWQAVGDGVNGVVYAVAVAPDGRVFVGGDFTQAGGQPAKNIAQWNGQEWLPLAEGVNKPVNALTIDGTHLYIGGEFSSAGTIPASLIARWDLGTQQWEALGDGLRGHFVPHVASIVVLDGSVLAVGNFYQSGGDSLHHSAAWDGNRWNPLGSGLDLGANAAVATSEGFFVGGDFTRAGTNDSYYFAHWKGSVSANTSYPGDAATRTVRAVPNPVSHGENVMLLGVPPAASVAIYSLLGQRLRTLYNVASSGVVIPTADLSPGAYHCAITSHKESYVLPLIVQ